MSWYPGHHITGREFRPNEFMRTVFDLIMHEFGHEYLWQPRITHTVQFLSLPPHRNRPIAIERMRAYCHRYLDRCAAGLSESAEGVA